MASQPVKVTLKKVRPLLSTTDQEAKRRVLNLFKQWCREIDHMSIEYEIPLTYNQVVQVIRNEFEKHKNVKDIRVIDMLVLKGHNELVDVQRRLRSSSQFYYKFKLPNDECLVKKDFLAKFIKGVE